MDGTDGTLPELLVLHEGEDDGKEEKLVGVVLG